jgi:hypothetical protein
MSVWRAGARIRRNAANGPDAPRMPEGVIAMRRIGLRLAIEIVLTRNSDDQHPLQMALILRSRATSAGSRFISTGILTSGLVVACAVVFGAR